MTELSEQTHEVLQELSKDRLIDTILLQAEKIDFLNKQIVELEGVNTTLKIRIDKLEAKLNSNSTNSSQPPSSDKPFNKPVRNSGKKGKPGAKKGHKGHRQEMLSPNETINIPPAPCSCGCEKEYNGLVPFYTHQNIELPEIQLKVTHFVLLQGRCADCGKLNKAQVPDEYTTGYGPRMTAVIAELAGNHGDSRTIIQNFCFSVLGFSISLGAIQKVLDRASAAIKPVYEAIGDKVRQAESNHVDETSWLLMAKLIWLWVLTNAKEAFFMIHSQRSGEAFKILIGDWAGLLISDGYRVYTTWVGLRQTCLAHLIRDAKALSERKTPDIAKFGENAMNELQRLCHMAHEPPSIGEWRMFYARFIKLISRNIMNNDETGKYARRLMREIDSLWVFLEKAGVSPTNNPYKAPVCQ